MFFRMLLRAAALRRGRAMAALLAVVVAATVTTALLTLYTDVQAKLHEEFRKYGANIVVVARDGQALPGESLHQIEAVLGSNGIAVPFAYVVATSADGRPVVVSGTDMALVRRLNGWWSVTAWPIKETDALIGTRAAAQVADRGGAVDLRFQDRAIHLNVAGVLSTGAAEDSRIYLSLEEFEGWTGVQPSAFEIAATGSPLEINETVSRLAQAFPQADVRPVRQVLEGEARVLGKTRAMLLVCALLIVLTSTLCVLSTLMGWVFDRRRDFAIMKALGASEMLVAGFFAAEAVILGLAGALIGSGAGVALAMWIGRANFHAPVVPRLTVLPQVLAGGVGLALLAAVLPIVLLRRVQPATILRGE